MKDIRLTVEIPVRVRIVYEPATAKAERRAIARACELVGCGECTGAGVDGSYSIRSAGHGKARVLKTIRPFGAMPSARCGK